jgi:hypothetical protein
LLKSFGYSSRVKHIVADDVVDFVKHDQIPFPGGNRRPRLFPSHIHQPLILWFDSRSAHLDEAPAHLFDDKVAAKSLGGVELAVMPRAFKKLQHKHAHTAANRAQSRTQCRRGFTLAVAGVDQD